ncbi:MAG: phosphate ABC transporter substrate-binding protein [bacterium]
MSMRTRWLAPALLCGLALFACRKKAETVITLAGSTSVQPFAERLAEVYMAAHKGVEVNVQGGGSSAGVRAVQNGICQVGMSSRPLTYEERAIAEVPIALDGIVLIVHRDNPVRALTLEQARRVFTGEVQSWRALGGADRRITVITREEGSGTRSSFEDRVMAPPHERPADPRPGPQPFAADALVQDSNGAVREIVASDPAAIGYISFGLVDDRVRALELDGVAPSHDAIKSGAYPLVRRFLFLTSGKVAAPVRRFIDYALGAEGQAVLEEEGLTTINR